jgi:hypothetical protein
MATFISTTLDKRTGATTSVFAPSSKQGDHGILAVAGTYAGLTPELRISSRVAGNGTRTAKVRITVPQIEASGDFPIVKSRPYIEATLVVPVGTLATDVDDLVGYLNDALSTGTTNINDLMVGGVGVY